MKKEKAFRAPSKFIRVTAADLSSLLKSVPTERFVRMASTCGLPTMDSRALCEAFKDLKG